MILSKNDLLSLTKLAISAAMNAGQIINRYSQQKLLIKNKSGGDSLASQVITQVDMLSQQAIINSLKSSCKTYDLAILTEETEDDHRRLEKPFFWCIDPLDGTLPFTESRSGYAVSIALVSRSGTPLVGVIYDPLNNTLYHAIKNAGAYRNKAPWQVDNNLFTANKYLTHICDRSFVQQKNYSQIMSEVEIIANQLGYSGIKTIQHGGAAMNACWVLENNPACYFKFPKPQKGGGSLWDYAATSCLFNEIGAIAGDINLDPIELNRAESTFLNHQGIIYSSNKALATRISKLYKKLT